MGFPFLAPVLMRLGWEGPANLLYSVYGFLCHQLPQRSFFLFGSKFVYPLGEIQAAWQNTCDPMVLREFIGSQAMGWKVAWSDHMVSMYSSIWIFGWLWYPLRRKIKPLALWGLMLLILPMAIDGSTHLVSDLWGIGQGFRDSNLWLVNITGNLLPLDFYAGDALGSFNSWMRLLTGALFGLGIVWFSFPHLETTFTSFAKELRERSEFRGELTD